MTLPEKWRIEEMEILGRWRSREGREREVRSIEEIVELWRELVFLLECVDTSKASLAFQ